MTLHEISTVIATMVQTLIVLTFFTAPTLVILTSFAVMLDTIAIKISEDTRSRSAIRSLLVFGVHLGIGPGGLRQLTRRFG